MNAAGLLLGALAQAPSASWHGGNYTLMLATTGLVALAMIGLALYWRDRRRQRRSSAVPTDPARDLKERLQRRLSETSEPFAAVAGAAPTVGAGEAVAADLDAAAKAVLPEAGWRCGVAKHLLRRQLSTHAAGGGNGSEAARWRQLGALALIDDTYDGLMAYARAAELAPDDADLQMLLGVLHLRSGNHAAAEPAFRRQIELADGKEGSEATRYRARIMLGDVLLAKGDRAAALVAFEAARAEVLALAEREPEATRWRRDAAVTHDRIGDLRLTEGDPDQALESFRKSLQLSEEIAAREPASPERQHDLSVAHDRIGEALALTGDLDGALASYRRSLGVAEAVAALAPERTDWRWDVSASHDRIGDTLAAKGEIDEALAALRRGLAIAETLAAADPARGAWRLEWQRDLAVSYHKIGLLEAQRGRETEAREALDRGKAIIARLAEIARYQAQWRADLSKFDAALRSLGP